MQNQEEIRVPSHLHIALCTAGRSRRTVAPRRAALYPEHGRRVVGGLEHSVDGRPVVDSQQALEQIRLIRRNQSRLVGRVPILLGSRGGGGGGL